MKLEMRAAEGGSFLWNAPPSVFLLANLLLKSRLGGAGNEVVLVAGLRVGVTFSFHLAFELVSSDLVLITGGAAGGSGTSAAAAATSSAGAEMSCEISSVAAVVLKLLAVASWILQDKPFMPPFPDLY